jgi:hypothetical protein
MSKKSDTLERANSFITAFEVTDATEPMQAELAKFMQVNYKLSRQEIADAMGLTLRQVQTRLVSYKAYAAKGLIPTGILGDGNTSAYLEDPREAVIKDEEERINRGYANAEAREALDASIFEERFAAAVAKHIPTERNIETIESLYAKVKPKRPATAGEEEAAIAIMSDWHLGLENPFYGEEIAVKALNRFVEKTVRLTELHRTQCPVRKIYFCPLGDEIQGSSGNFPAQRWTVHTTAVDQADALTGHLISTIERLLVEYDEVEIVAMPGNHGALYSKKVSVEPDHSNIEHVAHRTLRWVFRNHPRVKFHLTDEWYQVVDIMGVRFLMQHGHMLGGGAGNFDGMVATFRKLADVLPEYDAAVVGHFHRLARLPLPTSFGKTGLRTLYMNGTSILGDEHSLQFGAGHTRAWWCLFAGGQNPKITAEYAVNLYE